MSTVIDRGTFEYTVARTGGQGSFVQRVIHSVEESHNEIEEVLVISDEVFWFSGIYVLSRSDPIFKQSALTGEKICEELFSLRNTPRLAAGFFIRTC